MSDDTHTTNRVNDSTLFPVALIEREGEARALDTDIADRLGMARPTNIRSLIEANRAELEWFGPLHSARAMVAIGSGAKRAVTAFYLNEEQALLVSTISKAPNAPAVRAMLIRTFVAWRRGQLDAPGIDMRAIGGMVKGVLAKQLNEMIPSLVAAEVASRTLAIRRGKTAGQIWKEAGFPPIRIGGWFSRKLREMGCEISGGGCGELGLATARLFDPDKATAWLRNGGRMMVETKLAERMGQGRLRLVQPAA